MSSTEKSKDEVLDYDAGYDHGYIDGWNDARAEFLNIANKLLQKSSNNEIEYKTNEA
jgi:hypothetical protein